MKRVRLAVGLVLSILLLSAYPGRLAAESPASMIIDEIQTGSQTSASEEFIELVNNSNGPIDLNTWRVEYFSASAANFNSPTRTMSLHGSLNPDQHYLLASTNYLTSVADQSYSATLAQAGGHLRLVSTLDNQTTVHDLVGWGSAQHPETDAAPAPKGGESLQRKNDRGDYTDTDNNAEDFAISTTPTPESSTAAVDPPASSEPAAMASAAPQLTELLPNPAPPAHDDQDEFIELYNPNDQPFDLRDYKLQTGNNYTYSFTFTTQSLPPQSYVAFYASQTRLTLANAGGRARLVNPNGQMVSETTPYDAATDGAAWVWLDDSWQWTSRPTPGAPNVGDADSAEPTLTSTKPAAFPKAPKASAPATKKASATKSTAGTKPKMPTKSPTVSDTSATASSTPTATLHPGVLAVVGGLALLYAAYEYRYDVANKIYQFRTHRAARRAARAKS